MGGIDGGESGKNFVGCATKRIDGDDGQRFAESGVFLGQVTFSLL